MRVSLYVLRDATTKNVVYAGRTGDMKARKGNHERHPSKGAGTTQPIVCKWADEQIAKGTPPICEEIGEIDLSCIQSEDLRKRARKQIERAVIEAVCDDAIRRHEIALNMHGNPYRQHNTGEVIVDFALADEIGSIAAITVEATSRAAKHLQPTGGAK